MRLLCRDVLPAEEAWKSVARKHQMLWAEFALSLAGVIAWSRGARSAVAVAARDLLRQCCSCWSGHTSATKHSQRPLLVGRLNLTYRGRELFLHFDVCGVHVGCSSAVGLQIRHCLVPL